MTRTTPDPLFAEAARAEVLARIRRESAAARPATDRPGRVGLRELVAAAVVVTAVTAVVVGAQQVHLTGEPTPAGGKDPVPAATATIAAPTATESPAPSASAPQTSPAPDPVTSAPVTPPPASSAPPTSAPATTPAGALIGPTGARERSEAEIRAWAATIGVDAISTEQDVLDTQCMAGKGFLYDPELGYRSGLLAEREGLTDEQWAAYSEAEYGPETTEPYDWRTAGCHGRSVHLTGQDDNH